jgi:hypothetical protein
MKKHSYKNRPTNSIPGHRFPLRQRLKRTGAVDQNGKTAVVDEAVQNTAETRRRLKRWKPKPLKPCPDCGREFTVPAIRRGHLIIRKDTGECLPAPGQ